MTTPSGAPFKVNRIAAAPTTAGSLSSGPLAAPPAPCVERQRRRSPSGRSHRLHSFSYQIPDRSDEVREVPVRVQLGRAGVRTAAVLGGTVLRTDPHGFSGRAGNDLPADPRGSIERDDKDERGDFRGWTLPDVRRLRVQLRAGRRRTESDLRLVPGRNRTRELSQHLRYAGGMRCMAQYHNRRSSFEHRICELTIVFSSIRVA